MIKFGLLYIATAMTNSSRYMIGHSRLIAVGKAHKLNQIANFFGILRIISRYPRTRGLASDLYKLGAKVRTEIDAWKFFELLMCWVGDLLNLLYFFIDHYMGLFLLGMFTNQKNLEFADFWGNYIWTWSSFFYFLKNLVQVYNYQKDAKKLK